MAIVRIGGAGAPNLPVPGLVPQYAPYSATNTPPFTGGFNLGLTNVVTLAAGQLYLIPSGTYQIKTGPYTFLQFKDPVLGEWKVRPTAKDEAVFVNSDGSNFRLANTTGCVIGAVITTSTCTGAVNGIGTATTLVSCVASSGASTWVPIVGGAVSLTFVTATTSPLTTGGSGYLYPPLIVIDAPPAGGYQATAYVTALSGGTINSAAINVINQGAGYTSPPAFTFVNDPRDTVGGGAIYACTLTATGTLTGLYPNNHGTSLTGIPTLSFALTNGGAVSCAATAIMNFTVTGYLTGAVGAGLTGVNITSIGNTVTATAQGALNPLHTTGLTFPRPCRIQGGLSAGTLVVAGQIVEDGGLGIQNTPVAGVTIQVTATGFITPVPGALSLGGTTDTCYIQAV